MEIRGTKSHVGSEWDDWEDDVGPEDDTFVLVQAPSSGETNDSEDDADGFVLTTGHREGAPDTCHQEGVKSQSIDESVQTLLERNFDEVNDRPTENRGFEVHINFYGTCLLVVLLLVGEIYHYVYECHP